MQTAQGLAGRERRHKEARKAELKRQSAERKWRLAKKIDDPVYLILALRFYIEWLNEPGEWTGVSEIKAVLANKPRRFRRYLKAARRILCLQCNEDGSQIRMPRNIWMKRLVRIGFKFHLRSEEKGQFLALNYNLEVTNAVEAFAAKYPQFLEKVQLFLSDGYRPSVTEVTGGEQRPSEQELADKRAEQQRVDQWWMPPTDEPEAQSASLAELLSQPGPFANKHVNDGQEWREHEELLKAVQKQQRVTESWDEAFDSENSGREYDRDNPEQSNEPDFDEGETYHATSIRRRISRHAQGEPSPEVPSVTSNRRRYSPDAPDPTRPHPFEPRDDSPSWQCPMARTATRRPSA